MLNNINNANEMVIWPYSEELKQHRKWTAENKTWRSFLGSEKKFFVSCCFALHHKHKKKEKTKKSCKDQIIQ